MMRRNVGLLFKYVVCVSCMVFCFFMIPLNLHDWRVLIYFVFGVVFLLASNHYFHEAKNNGW